MLRRSDKEIPRKQYLLWTLQSLLDSEREEKDGSQVTEKTRLKVRNVEMREIKSRVAAYGGVFTRC